MKRGRKYFVCDVTISWLDDFHDDIILKDVTDEPWDIRQQYLDTEQYHLLFYLADGGQVIIPKRSHMMLSFSAEHETTLKF